MYGYFLDTQATAYLAEISEVSRAWATSVLMTELNRANAVRLWLHDVLEELAWRDHPEDCCALSNPEFQIVAVQIRGCYRAIVHGIAQRCEALDSTPAAFIRSIEPWEAAHTVHGWTQLGTYCDLVRQEIGDIQAERQASFDKMIKDNTAGRF